MDRLWASAASLGIALAAVTSGCGAPSPTPSSTPSSLPETSSPSDFASARSVVAIGDSIPYNSPQDCPGCTGFVNSYTGALGEREGEAYAAFNRSRHDGARVADVLEEVQSGSLDEELSEAHVIIVSVGYNDQPPYSEGSCFNEANNTHNAAGAAAAITATTAECITTQTAAAGADFAVLLGSVRDLAPDALILALGVYNAWTGWPQLDALGTSVEEPVSQVIVAGLEAWRTVVCEAAANVGGECVDLLLAFNGSDGLTPSGDLLAEDYTHPSQKGNDLIRDVLLEY